VESAKYHHHSLTHDPVTSGHRSRERVGSPPDSSKGTSKKTSKRQPCQKERKRTGANARTRSPKPKEKKINPHPGCALNTENDNCRSALTRGEPTRQASEKRRGSPPTSELGGNLSGCSTHARLQRNHPAKCGKCPTPVKRPMESKNPGEAAVGYHSLPGQTQELCLRPILP